MIAALDSHRMRKKRMLPRSPPTRHCCLKISFYKVLLGIASLAHKYGTLAPDTEKMDFQGWLE